MKKGLLLALVCVATSVAADTRPPAVAGAFYTNDAEALRSQIETMLQEARGSGEAVVSRAIVAPHAGYVYSGAVAAKAFVTLPERGIERVILLGPSHHVSYGGGALPAVGMTAFRTPLGDVPLDLEVLTELRGRPQFSGPASAHGPEHSLEVELPFIQIVAPEAKLVPIVVGANTDPVTSVEMARALSTHLGEKTVVIASSDFTHHGRRYGWAPYEGEGPELGDTLLEVGRETADLIAAMDARGLRTQVAVSGDTVCGVRPIEVLSHLLDHAFKGEGQVLEVTTSGHVTGSFDLSVTYAAIAFSGDWAPWSEPPAVEAVDLEETEGRELIELARASLHTRLTHDTALARWFSAHGDTKHVLMPAGAFVTLNNNDRRAKKEGRLRACMGVIEAEQPLVEAVVQAAVWAAQDPRFPPLELDELAEVSVEVSVLSPARPVKSFRLIEVGKHGVVMAKDGRRAVFLPQVATEQGWDRETMLEHLSAKAGLPRNAWQHGAEFEVFTAQVFSEHR